MSCFVVSLHVLPAIRGKVKVRLAFLHVRGSWGGCGLEERSEVSFMQT